MDKATKILVNRIHSELERRQWTQKELADACGLSRAHVNNLLSAKNSPTLRLCERIAEGLKMSVSELLEPEKKSDDDVLAGLFRYWDEARRRSKGDPYAREFFETFDRLIKLYEKKTR